jgi:hypothetical protein
MRCESFWQWAQAVHSPKSEPSLSSWRVASVSRKALVALRMRFGLMLRVAFCQASVGCAS